MADADSSRERHPLVASARGISLAGFVLCAVYLSILAGSLLPLKVLDPLWQLRLGSSMINAAPFPLLGLALVHLAGSLDPLDPLLTSRRRSAAQLAVLAAVGFVLLVPLMSFGAIQQQHIQSTSQAAQIAGADARIKALRGAVAASNSTVELNDRLVALRGPELSSLDKTKPLGTIKTQISLLLDQFAAQFARQSQLTPRPSPWQLLPDLLRNSFASLALAVGFAGLARRRQVSYSLLEELQRWWQARSRRPLVAPRQRWWRQWFARGLRR